MTQLTERGELVIGSLTARGELVIGAVTATGRIVFPASAPTEIGDGYDWYQEWPNYRPQKRQEPRRQAVRSYRRGVVAMAARFSGRARQAFRRQGAAGVSGRASGAVQQRIGDELWLFGLGSDEDDLLFGARKATKAARDAVDRLLDSVDAEARRWAEDATAGEAAVKTYPRLFIGKKRGEYFVERELTAKKLMDIRNQRIADGGALLSEDEIEAEVKARRGGIDAVLVAAGLSLPKSSTPVAGQLTPEARDVIAQRIGDIGLSDAIAEDRGHIKAVKRDAIDALLDSVDDDARAWAEDSIE